MRRPAIGIVSALVVLSAATGCGDPPAKLITIPAPTSSTTPVQPGATATPMPHRTSAADAANAHAAAVASKAAVAALHFGGPTTVLPGKPAGWPQIETSLGALLETHWYAVSASPATVATYLRRHPPKGMRATETNQGGNASGGITDDVFVLTHPRAPQNYSGPTLLVGWRTLNGRTVVRVDSFGSPRYARLADTLVTGPISQVEVSRTFTPGTSKRSRPPIQVNITRPAVIGSLIRAVNAAYGSEVHRSYHSCRAPQYTELYSVTFPSIQHTLIFRWTAGCVGDEQVTVLRDGQPLSITLDLSAPIDLTTTVTRGIAGQH